MIQLRLILSVGRPFLNMFVSAAIEVSRSWPLFFFSPTVSHFSKVLCRPPPNQPRLAHFGRSGNEGTGAVPHCVVLSNYAMGTVFKDFTTNQNIYYNSPIPRAEFNTALSQAKNSAPGEDGIGYQMLKHLPESAITLLLDIYNRVWVDGNILNKWKSAILLPFQKPGKSSNRPDSYRPTVLTSNACKVHEKIINTRLVHYLDSNDLISPQRYGFRRSRSMEEVLVALETAILYAFASHKQLFAMFYDLEKAYNTAWRRDIQHILQQIYNFGIRGKMARFLSDFLHNRHFRVRIGGVFFFSNYYDQRQRVPQGSVLSCTLFMIAINGIVAVLPPNVLSAHLYVDDFAIYFTASHIATAH